MNQRHNRIRGFSHFPSLVVLFILSIALTSGIYCQFPEEKSEAESPYLNHHDSVEYVGIQVCGSCHHEIYESFIQTGMGSSFDIASKHKSAADFSKHHVVYDKFRDLYYHPYWANDSMYITEYRLEGRDTVHKRTERVSYIIGSGQHTNSHLMEVNGYVYQLPLTWYAQKKKWDLPPGFEDGRNVRFSREMGLECMSCHNALPGYVKNSNNMFTNIPRGIDCERCHGPGEVHVKQKLAGIRIDTVHEVDYSIVNPKKLTWELQTDICQRCHLQGNAILKKGKSFTDFRPGKKLADFIEVYMPKYTGSDDEFIMASHPQRLQLSKCFIQSNRNGTNNLTCITCHNPHVSVKVTGKEVFNTACNKCHVSPQQLCTEKESVRKANGDNCWGCHMPKSGTIDIPHVTVTDHRIHIPAGQKQKDVLKQFAGIYCINHPESDDETHARAYLSYAEKFEGEKSALDSAEKYFQHNKDASVELELKVHWCYLKSDNSGIVQLAKSLHPADSEDPWFCYRIGQAYQNLQDVSKSLQWYERSVILAPENLDFQNKMAAVMVQSGRYNEAIEKLNALLRMNEEQPETYTNLGFAYVSAGDKQNGMRCYNRALQLDPDMQQTLFNKAALCNMNGDKVEAKKLLQHILKRDPGNSYILRLYQSL